MSLTSLFSHKTNDPTQVVLLIDVGSASIGAALTLIRKGKKPRIVYTVRRPLVLQESLDFDRFVTSMRTTLDEVLQTVEREGLSHLTFTRQGNKKIHRTFLVYASPWYISQTKILKVDRKRPFVVTEELINKVISDEEHSFATSQDADLSEHMKEGAVAIERKVTDIRLEGYKVSEPMGKSVRHATFTVSMALVSKGVLDITEGSVKRVFHSDAVVHHSFPLVSSSVLRNIYHDTTSFLIVDVTGEVTDVTLIMDDRMMETASFPLGRNSILRTVGSKLGISADEALSLVQLYAEGDVSSDRAQDLEVALREAQREWSGEFERTLGELVDVGVIPENVFVMSGRGMDRLLRRFIGEGDFAQTTLTAGPFNITSINGGELTDHVQFRGKDMQDPFLGVEAIFVDILFTML